MSNKLSINIEFENLTQEQAGDVVSTYNCISNVIHNKTILEKCIGIKFLSETFTCSNDLKIINNDFKYIAPDGVEYTSSVKPELDPIWLNSMKDQAGPSGGLQDQ